MTLERDYENQEVLDILRTFFEDNEIDHLNYCVLYELLEGHLA